MSTPIKVGIIGGSGLDDPDILKNRRTKPVESTPFGQPSDHLILGEIDGIDCVLLARHGRKHDVMPTKVNYRANIWALKEEGCTHILASTATGSLRENITPGDVVILDNFIDHTRTRIQTFYDGEEGHPKGVCHLQMMPAFSEKLRHLIIETANELNINVHKTGTVVAIEGPRFSSRAESNIFRQWGGDVINMTSMPEIVLAKEAGLCYAAIALATDYDCWRNDGKHVAVTDVLTTFKNNVNKVTSLIVNVVPKIAKDNWDQEIDDLKATVKNSIML